MATRMQQRRGTSAQWENANPILNVGEIGFETDTNQFKIGDGTNHWDDLSYFIDETALGTSLDDYVEVSLLGVPDGVATLNSSGVLDSSQLPDISEITADTMNDVIIAGSGILKDYDDNGNTLTLSVDPEALGELSQDAINDALTAGTGITKTYDDSANTLTLEIDSNVVATLSGTQTLTNKTLTSPIVNLSLNEQTGTTFTPILSDNGKVVTLDNVDAILVTVPTNNDVSYPNGAQINLAQTGAGQVTIQGDTGVTVNGTPGLKLRAQYSVATLIKVGTNSWILAGDLSE